MKITIIDPVIHVDKKEVPLYKHDCDQCIFLGNFTYAAPHGSGVGADRREWTVDLTVDCYYCPSKSMGGTMIARFGSEGPEYSSCSADIMDKQIKKLMETPPNQLSTFKRGTIEAYLRAEKLGYYKGRK